MDEDLGEGGGGQDGGGDGVGREMEINKSGSLLIFNTAHTKVVLNRYKWWKHLQVDANSFWGDGELGEGGCWG